MPEAYGRQGGYPICPIINIMLSNKNDFKPQTPLYGLFAA